jgi:energy-coupling factor transporter transmembrane protein EcfT
MDIQTPIIKLALALALVIVVFVISILCYGIVGVYFLIDGVRLQSGGGILLGLACWGGVALFSLPLWFVSTLRSQTKLFEQYTAHLQNILRTSRGEEAIREISSAKVKRDE